MPRLRQFLSPGDREFFDLLEEAGENIAQAASLLERMLRNYPEHAELAAQVRVCEHRGDRITHDVIHKLYGTNVTPIEREDIYALVSALDDVVDYTEEVADYLGLYKIEAPMEQAQRQSQILVEATTLLCQAIPMIRGHNDISDLRNQINQLENQGDRVVREAIASLFEPGIDPIVVIRWKDIFERLEQAIDSCERVVNLLDGIIAKSS